MNVGNICTRDTVVCRRDTTALDAARLIRNHHVGDLVVIDDSNGKQTPVGIITDRDIVVSVVAKEVDPAAVFVSDMMSAPLVTSLRLGGLVASDPPHAAARDETDADYKRCR